MPFATEGKAALQREIHAGTAIGRSLPCLALLQLPAKDVVFPLPQVSWGNHLAALLSGGLVCLESTVEFVAVAVAAQIAAGPAVSVDGLEPFVAGEPVLGTGQP